MPAYTNNFNLYKPNRADSEQVDITLSDNFDKIDTEIKNRKNEIEAHANATVAHNSRTITHGEGTVESAFTEVNSRVVTLGVEVNSRIDEVDQRVSSLANEAVNIAIDVQNQFDEVVNRATDTDAMSRQAAIATDGTDFKNLKDRLDAEHRSVSSQLAQTTYYLTPEMFNAKGDGITDDTQAFKDLVTAIGNSKAVIYFGKSKNYIISSPVVINKSHIKIYGNQSTLTYTGTSSLGTTNGTNGIYGILTFNGSASTQTTITSIEKIYDSAMGLVLKVNTTAVVEKGKKYKLNLSTGAWTTNYTDEQYTVDAIIEVVSVGSGYFYTNYVPPFDFYLGGTFSGTITNVSLLENISICDLFLTDTSTGEKNKTTVEGNPSLRNAWVGGLNFTYCDNITLENVQSNNLKFPAIKTGHVDRVTIKNSIFKFPFITSAGCGYGIQFNQTTNIHAENLLGDSLRHLVDFSGSSNGLVKDSTSINDINTMGSFGLHGICEFNITFDNCTGSAYCGSGTIFPMVSDNVKILNCNFYQALLTVCKNLYIENSYIGLLNSGGARYYDHLVVKNSTLPVRQMSHQLKGSRPNDVVQKTAKFIDCTFIINDERKTGTWDLVLTDKSMYSVEFENCQFNVTNKDIICSLTVDSKFFVLKGCKGDAMSFINANNSGINIQVLNSQFTNKSTVIAPNFLAIYNDSAVPISLRIKDSDIVGNATKKYRWLRCLNDMAANSNKDIILTGNYFEQVDENTYASMYASFANKIVKNNVLANATGNILGNNA